MPPKYHQHESSRISTIDPHLPSAGRMPSIYRNGSIVWSFTECNSCFSVQTLCLLENLIIVVERLEQYMHIHSEAPEIIQDNRPALNWPEIGRVEIHDLKVRNRPNAPLVLRGMSYIIKGGNKIGIVGRTGSGKTTLISALFRLCHSPKSNSLSGSVRYNLDPLEEHMDQQIWEAFEKCQLWEAIQEKEEGLYSLGKLQRV
ncbi:hypothetical protein HYC85_013158 [Camellia sinensis]|uniref:ABC transporter domain-containing protein n=1 Tax=Camellia sinensis TaxID=4442 RepID=A0A7J7H4S1_CAMSI|nr:hypothetical protein HYC85_013158 [Camellia sinensis]